MSARPDATRYEVAVPDQLMPGAVTEVSTPDCSPPPGSLQRASACVAQATP